MILFGAGRLGHRIWTECRRRNIPVEAFSDNNPALWGTYIHSIPVCSPPEAASLFREEDFLVTIFNGRSVREQLRRIGLKVVSTPQFLLDHSIRLGDFGLEPASYYKQPEIAVAVTSLMRIVDRKSQLELSSQWEWRAGGMLDDTILPSCDDPGDLYFPDFLMPIEDEVYFDCGAYDGDTVSKFQLWNTNYRKVVAFEPVQEVKATGEVHILRTGLGSGFRYTCFSDEGPGSHQGRGSIPGTIVPLDWFYELKPTLIKMDIEGSELDALHGAREILRDLKPALAVCLYHKASHLWEVPLLIHSMNPDYRLLIRRYADDCAELVCYAIPEERLK